MLEKAKNIEFAENQVTINASINSISREQIEKLAKELA
jgi:hypothetical protein